MVVSGEICIPTCNVGTSESCHGHLVCFYVPMFAMFCFVVSGEICIPTCNVGTSDNRYFFELPMIFRVEEKNYRYVGG